VGGQEIKTTHRKLRRTEAEDDAEVSRPDGSDSARPARMPESCRRGDDWDRKWPVGRATAISLEISNRNNLRYSGTRSRRGCAMPACGFIVDEGTAVTRTVETICTTHARDVHQLESPASAAPTDG